MRCYRVGSSLTINPNRTPLKKALAARGAGAILTRCKGNDALSNQKPPYNPLGFSVATVNGLVGLADGNCHVLAFQNGNDL